MDPTAAANQAMTNSGARDQMTREVAVMLSANTGDYQKEMQKAAEQTNKLADALLAVEKAYIGTLKFIGKGMMGLGASMQATAVGAVWSAAQFEESFARVAKTTGLQNEMMGKQGRGADFFASLGLGNNELQEFQNDIRGLSTEIPVSVQELAYLADVAGTLDVDSENLVLFADTASKLGAAINDLGSDQAIAGLANLIGAFGRAEEHVTNLGSSLADLANYTRGNASEMLQFSDRLAGTAVQVGMTAEEVLGLGAAVSAIGARPELGASAMVQTLNQISLAVQRGGRDLDNFANAMNLTGQEMKAMWSNEGPTAVVTRLLQTLNAQGEEAVSTLRNIGLSGVGTSQVLGGLSAQLGVYTESMYIANKASEENSAIQELAAIRFDTVYKAMQQLGQATAEVFRSFGVGFLAPFKILIDLLIKMVNIWNMIPQPVKTAIGLFLGLGGAVMVVAGAFTVFFASFHAFFAAIYALPLILDLVKKGLAAIGPGSERAANAIGRLQKVAQRASDALAWMEKKYKVLRTTMKDEGWVRAAVKSWEYLSRKAKETWQAFLVHPKVEAAKAKVTEIFGNIWPKITEGLSSASSAIRTFFSDKVGEAMYFIRELLPSFEEFRKSVGEVLGSAADTVSKYLKDLRKRVLETPILGDALRTMKQQASRMFADIFGARREGEDWNPFQNLLKFARSTFGTLSKLVKRRMGNLRKTIASALGEDDSIFKNIIGLARSAADRMISPFRKVGASIKKFVSEHLEDEGVFGIFSRGISKITAQAKNFYNTMMQPRIENLRQTLGNAFDNVWSAISESASRAFPNLFQEGMDFRGMVSSIRHAIKDVMPSFDDIKSGIGSALEGASRIVRDFVDNVVARLQDIFPRIAETLGSMRTNIAGFFRTLFQGSGDDGDTFFRRLASLAGDGFKLVKETVGAKIDSMRDFTRAGLDHFLPIVRTWASDLRLNFEAAFAIRRATITRNIKRFGTNALNSLADAFNTMSTFVSDHPLREQISNAFTLSTEKLSSSFNWLKEKFGEFATYAKAKLTNVLIPGFKSLATEIGKGLVAAFSALKRASSWLFVEFFVKDTFKIMNTALGVIAWTLDHVAAGFAVVSTKITQFAAKRTINSLVDIKKLKAAFPGLSALIYRASLDLDLFRAKLKLAVGGPMLKALSKLRGGFALLGVAIKWALGPIALIIAAVGAVGAALWGWDKWKNRNEEVTHSIYELATAAGLASEEVERLSWALSGSGTDNFQMAVQGQSVISSMRGMSNNDVEDFAFTYAASLVRGGQPPEQVIDHVNELLRLAGQSPIIFKYTFAELSHGEGYEQWLDAAGGTASRFFEENLPDFDGLGGAWRRLSPNAKLDDEFGSAWGDMLRNMKDVGESNLPALEAMFVSLGASIDAAVEKGDISANWGNRLRGELYEYFEDDFDGELPGVSDPSAMRQAAAGTISWINSYIVGTENNPDWVSEALSGGAPSEQERLARVLEDENFVNTDGFEELAAAVEEVTGETDDLSEALRSLDADEFDEVSDALIKAAAEMQETQFAVQQMDVSTGFGRKLKEAEQAFGGGDSYRKFEQHLMETYQHHVGHVRAIREIATHTEEVAEEVGEWSDEAEAFRNALRNIQEEYANMQIQELRVEFADMSPHQHLDYIRDEIRGLDMDSPENELLYGELQGLFQEAQQQQVQTFRQTMQQYDQLIENEEQTIKQHHERIEKMEENHNERLQKMEEDYQKNVKKAHENHEKRLEDIAEAEKKSLEQRAEQVASAFNLMERLQASPSASIGAVTTNMARQNEALREMQENVQELLSMGLDEDLIPELGFDDPNNFNAVIHLLESAKNDPDLIREMNDLWKEQMGLAEAFVDTTSASDITEQYDEQREKAVEALDEQLEEMKERYDEALSDTNESFAKSIDEANENHQRQIENIGEALAKLGEDTFETIDELLERAFDSSLEHLTDFAGEVERQIRELERMLSHRPDSDDYEDIWMRLPEVRDQIRDGQQSTGSPAEEIRDDFGIIGVTSIERYENEYQTALDGLVGSGRSAANQYQTAIDGLDDVWREARTAAVTGLRSVTAATETEAQTTVDAYQNLISGLSEQDEVWSAVEQSGREGAQVFTDAIAEELEEGFGRIDTFEINFSMDPGMNPGANWSAGTATEIDRNPSPRGPSASGQPDRAMADGGLLFDQAKIQPPGTLIQWAEPETGGEAFIPLAPTKRRRSLEIWLETGKLLGVKMQELARGGMHDKEEARGFVQTSTALHESTPQTSGIDEPALRDGGPLMPNIYFHPGTPGDLARQEVLRAHAEGRDWDPAWHQNHDWYLHGPYAVPEEHIPSGGFSTPVDSPASNIMTRPEQAESMFAKRGREPMNADISGQRLVSALSQALSSASFGKSETNSFGPITVQAQDPEQMRRKLDRRRRLSKMTTGGESA